MTDAYQTQVESMSLAKALATAAYGESVAAYRYRTLLDRVTDESVRAAFRDMANEEQGHHVKIQQLQQKLFPGSDFVLTPADKELVIVGPRLLEITAEASLSQVLAMMIQSERRTGRFYAARARVTPDPELKSFMMEMAEECFDHAKLLGNLKPSD